MIADLGGTNLRVARIVEKGAPTEIVSKIRVADCAGLDDALAAAVDAAGAPPPQTAIVAFAGPLGSGPMRLTNHPWDIDPRRLRRRLDLADLILVNDFAAQALALPGFDDSNLRQIGGKAVVDHAAKLVLGPGTGLGVAGLVPSACGWTPVPGEAGHVDLAPGGEEEQSVWRNLRKAEGRVSAETVISGPGLLRLYRAVARDLGADPVLTAPQEVTAAADHDRLAARTLSIFARALGRAAGDLALVFLARGGVFLSGGIAPKILPWLEAGEFRAAFEDKAPHGAILRDIPVFVVTAPEPALAGLAALANGQQDFGIDLRSRRFSA